MQIEKIKVTATTRKLSATYKIEPMQFGIDVDSDALDELQRVIELRILNDIAEKTAEAAEAESIRKQK